MCTSSGLITRRSRESETAPFRTLATEPRSLHCPRRQHSGSGMMSAPEHSAHTSDKTRTRVGVDGWAGVTKHVHGVITRNLQVMHQKGGNDRRASRNARHTAQTKRKSERGISTREKITGNATNVQVRHFPLPALLRFVHCRSRSIERGPGHHQQTFR